MSQLCTLYVAIKIVYIVRPRPIMLKFLPIMLLSVAQKFTHYAQYYAYIALSTVIWEIFM